MPLTVTDAVFSLLPTEVPLQLIDTAGAVVECRGFAVPPAQTLLDLHRKLVIGRRFDAQATALTKQGRLAVYPSSRGQEACQVGVAAALADSDWLFPTYRDCVALVSRGLDPVEVLTLLRGDWHCGYDPYATRVAPQCTPLATNTSHAVGLAHGLRLRGEQAAALVLLGDGATSEGDTHAALNFAAVWQAPVVFFIQNNGYAISVPLSEQSRAPSLAHKGIGYGIPSALIDGNDVAIVHEVVRAALGQARSGGGPVLIEALTYRIEAHTNADDATRYRNAAEVASWAQRDPLERIERHLAGRGLLDEPARVALAAEADRLAAGLRDLMNISPATDSAELFAHVYAEPSAQLRGQAAFLAAEETS